MQVWTQEDCDKGRCTAEDIDLPKTDHELWDWHDVDAKRIPAFLVHTPKPPSAWNNPPPPAPPEILDPDSAPSTDWIKSAFQGMGGKASFVAYCKNNPAQMWPLLLKGGLSQFLKEDIKPKNAYELSDEEIQSLSTLELRKLLLASKDICPHCKKSIV